MVRRLLIQGGDGRGERGRAITIRGSVSCISSVQGSLVERAVAVGESTELKRWGSRETLELLARKGLPPLRGVPSLGAAASALRARRDTLLAGGS